MTAKQYLSRAWALDSRIDSLVETKKQQYDRLVNITVNYNADGSQATSDPHRFDSLVAIEGQIDEMIDRMLVTKAETLETIERLNDWKLREVLKRRYIDMQTFEQIAYNMGYGWRHVMRLHKKGLQEIERVMNESV